MLFAVAEGLAATDQAEYARDFVRLRCTDDRARQADKESADINVIMRRHLAQGVLPQTRQVPVFADISEIHSLQEAMEMMDGAREVFGRLPADTRAAFDNDPRKFVAASQDEGARPLFEKLGLTVAKAAPPVEGGAAAAQ